MTWYQSTVYSAARWLYDLNDATRIVQMGQISPILIHQGWAIPCPKQFGWGFRHAHAPDNIESKRFCSLPVKSKFSTYTRIFLSRRSIVATSRIKGIKMATQMTKSQLIEMISTKTELAKKDVKGVFEMLAEVGYKELKKNGMFVVPGFAKFVVIKKPATKARKGTNPFTGEAMTFKAKPARKIVRARPVKAAKDAV
jgi:DNA-binding protein HU-beta